jgi:mRNA interferase MazF
VRINFDPQSGHEQKGWRPAVVLSLSAYNRRTGLAILCPVTNQAKHYPYEVPIPAGLPVTGVVLSDQLKSMDWQSRKAEYLCDLPAEVFSEVVDKAATLIDPEEGQG